MDWRFQEAVVGLHIRFLGNPEKLQVGMDLRHETQRVDAIHVEEVDGASPMTRFLRSPYAPLAAMALIAAYVLTKLALIVNGVVS